MKILGVNNYQVQKQNQNRNSNPNFGQIYAEIKSKEAKKFPAACKTLLIKLEQGKGAKIKGAALRGGNLFVVALEGVSNSYEKAKGMERTLVGTIRKWARNRGCSVHIQGYIFADNYKVH